MDHPVSDAVLGHALAGTASRKEMGELVAHLLRGCPDCACRLQAMLRREVPAGAYDRVLDRFEASLRSALEEPDDADAVLLSVVTGGQAEYGAALSGLVAGW
jgi:hypothetical protein